MRTAATPGEVDRLQEQLDLLHVDRDRKIAVTRMIFEIAGDCPVCEGPVRRCDPRRLVDEQLTHLACVALSATEEGRP